MSQSLADPPAPSIDRSPLTAGVICYTIWGLLPILFMWAGRAGAQPLEIVAWRIIWAAPCAVALVFATGQGASLRVLRPRDFAALAFTAALITLNWSTYVWAVNSGRTLSASLGYYINPLLNMAAGALLFQERISRAGMIAIGLAAIGVVLQGVALGAFPWVSVVLAVSFCLYGIVRKKIEVGAQTGLLVECLILVGPALAYAGLLAHGGHGAFGARTGVTVALLLGGPATLIPLALFAFAARRLPLSLIGFLQFIGPTLQFFIGVETGETLTPLRIASFVFIWAGVAVFAANAWTGRQRQA